MKPVYETLKEAGYTHVCMSGPGNHILKNEDGKLELWVANKFSASASLIYKNTHLEFVSSVNIPIGRV